MTHYTLKIILFFYFVFSNISGYAQLGYSENKIVEMQGKYFKKDINDSSIILTYNSTVIDDYGKSSPQIILYIIDKKTYKCYLEVYNCSKSVINTYYKTLDKMAAKIDEHTWENYNNNSIYVLKVDGNILNIEHSYAPLNSSDTSTNTNSTILSLQSDLNKCTNEKQNLSITINALKEQNQSLINTLKNSTILTSKGADNIEKALISIKEKDLKIEQYQKMIIEKDSLFLDYIKKTKSDKK